MMRDLDETDLRILRLLMEDGRRAYSDIAETVGVSPPTVSDRVERLEDLGVIRRFTLDIDRSKLDDGVGVLIDLKLRPGANGEVRERLSDVEEVEHVFATADSHLVVNAMVPQANVQPTLDAAIDMDDVIEYDVRLLSETTWNPTIGDTSLALTCDQCANTVDSEGESARFDDDLYHFCCESCLEAFEEEYGKLAESA